jgi:hypothetical protein
LYVQCVSCFLVNQRPFLRHTPSIRNPSPRFSHSSIVSRFSNVDLSRRITVSGLEASTQTRLTWNNEPFKMAGGSVRWARKSRVEIIRKGQLPALVVDVSKIEMGQATDVTIGPDDYIYVKSRALSV